MGVAAGTALGERTVSTVPDTWATTAGLDSVPDLSNRSLGSRTTSTHRASAGLPDIKGKAAGT